MGREARMYFGPEGAGTRLKGAEARQRGISQRKQASIALLYSVRPRVPIGHSAGPRDTASRGPSRAYILSSASRPTGWAIRSGW